MGSGPERNWAGQVFLGEGKALYFGHSADTAPHAHHAVQIAVPLISSLSLRVAGTIVPAAGAVAVAPDVEHQMGASPGPLAILYLDPESVPARQLAREWGGGSYQCWPLEMLSDLLPGLIKAAKTGADGQEAGRMMESILGVLIPVEWRPSPLDPRVLVALAMMKNEDQGLESLAQAVQLSPSRLGHLFSEQVGLPFRPYRLWLRLQVALQSLAGGVNLTTAAHQAGFADSAHLSRSFKRMFGIPPINLIRSGQMVHTPTLDSREGA